jgi:hypothetical protein
MHSEPPVYIDYAVMYRPDILWSTAELSLVVILTIAGVWIFRNEDLQGADKRPNRHAG